MALSNKHVLDYFLIFCFIILSCFKFLETQVIMGLLLPWDLIIAFSVFDIEHFDPPGSLTY